MKPMLAKDAVLEKLRFPLASQKKLDGIRVVIVNGVPLTRTLKEVPNREIFEALSHPDFEGLDGEILVGDPTAPDAYRTTASFVMAPNKTGEPWCFHVFDKWDEEGPFLDRWELATQIVDEEVFTSVPICMLDYQLCLTMQVLEAFEADTVAQGYEGVILRDPAGTYKFGRSYPKDGKLLKLKRFVDFEARVVGVYEEQHNGNEAVRNALGRTERSTKKEGKTGKGTLGGLVLVAVNGPCEGIEFRCGTGFNAAQRAALWAEWQASSHPSRRHEAGLSIIGRLAKIKSFPIGVKDKPRHPVFLGWRHEGDL